MVRGGSGAVINNDVLDCPRVGNVLKVDDANYIIKNGTYVPE